VCDERVTHGCAVLQIKPEVCLCQCTVLRMQHNRARATATQPCIVLQVSQPALPYERPAKALVASLFVFWAWVLLLQEEVACGQPADAFCAAAYRQTCCKHHGRVLRGRSRRCCQLTRQMTWDTAAACTWGRVVTPAVPSFGGALHLLVLSCLHRFGQLCTFECIGGIVQCCWCSFDRATVHIYAYIVLGCVCISAAVRVVCCRFANPTLCASVKGVHCEGCVTLLYCPAGFSCCLLSATQCIVCGLCWLSLLAFCSGSA
jgi:hypothetical protein